MLDYAAATPATRLSTLQFLYDGVFHACRAKRRFAIRCRHAAHAGTFRRFDYADYVSSADATRRCRRLRRRDAADAYGRHAA